MRGAAGLMEHGGRGAEGGLPQEGQRKTTDNHQDCRRRRTHPGKYNCQKYSGFRLQTCTFARTYRKFIAVLEIKQTTVWSSVLRATATKAWTQSGFSRGVRAERSLESLSSARVAPRYCLYSQHNGFSQQLQSSPLSKRGPCWLFSHRFVKKYQKCL